MLADLTALLSAHPPRPSATTSTGCIVEENCLGKKTTSNRWLTARHLADLYGLDQGVTVFRLLRFFWSADAAARPMLALLCAKARDALLAPVRQESAGDEARRDADQRGLRQLFQPRAAGPVQRGHDHDRLAQNVGASWTQAGFFKGKITKSRTRPVVTPAVAAYALAWATCAACAAKSCWKAIGRRLLDMQPRPGHPAWPRKRRSADGSTSKARATSSRSTSTSS